MTRPAIACLLGKPPKPGTIFDRIHGHLIARQVAVQILLPHQSGSLDAARWPAAALIVHRGLKANMLDQLSQHEAKGWPCCNSPASSILAQDRHALMSRLHAAGLPVPKWWKRHNWDQVIRIGAAQSIVVKAADGTIGRGTQVVIARRGEVQDTPPFLGPYLVEEHIQNDGLDRKLYVAGSRCFGLIKPWPRTPDASGQTFDVSPALADLAMATGAATGLEVFGVDVILGPQGPVIVDVNVFPGFNGIDDAPSAVADHLLDRLNSGPTPNG